MTKLFTEAERQQLLANGRETALGKDIDPNPVVKIFMPDGPASWLLTELDPTDEDIAFGLCDLGLGEPELGAVSIKEIEGIRGVGGFPPERDRFFRPSAPLSHYTERAAKAGKIVPITVGPSLCERWEYFAPSTLVSDGEEGTKDSASDPKP